MSSKVYRVRAVVSVEVIAKDEKEALSFLQVDLKAAGVGVCVVEDITEAGEYTESRNGED